MKWNRWLILFIFIGIASVSFINADSYWDYLTKGYADTLYCPITGNCGNSTSSGSNLTGSGCNDPNNVAVFYNTTHLICNTTAIGSGSSTAYNDSWINTTILLEIYNNNETLKDWVLAQPDSDTVLDDYCNIDGKMLLRIAGTWQCTDIPEGTNNGNGEINNANITYRLQEEAIYADIHIPKLSP